MKNISKTTSLGRVIAAVSTCLALAGGINTAKAADKTWNGGGDGFSWSVGGNWGGSAPVANDSLFFGGTTGLNNNNDLTANTVFDGVTFNSGAGAFTITGNEINLAGGVTNLSSNPQTLSLNLNHTSNRSHHAATNMTYDGAVKNWALLKYGPGTITLGGSLDNSSLRAEVYDGVLELAKTGNRALGGSPIVASGTGILRIVGPGTDQIHFNQRVVVTNGGVFQIQNSNEEIGAISGSSDALGIIENGLAGTTNQLTIGGGSAHEGIYSGIVRDGAGVLNLQVYRHDNKYTFGGTHTYTGTTAINNTSGSGITRMIMNGTHTGGGAYIINGHSSTTDRKAALCGSGKISAASMEARIRGLISPGGVLSADLTDSAVFTDTAAILTISNNVTITNGTLDIQLNGTAVGSGYDQLEVAGTGILTVTNGNLQLALGFTPANGDKFTIVKVQGAAPASTDGEFTSLNGVATVLTNGAIFVEPLSGKNFQISYRAEGSTFFAGGNDIMLQVVAPVGGANLTWRGNGTDNNWDVTTTANWWNGASLVTFTNIDFVTFDNTGTNNTPVNLVGDLTPATLTVNATKDYIFGGAGKLTGTITITKTNSGTLSLVTDNDPVGGTVIQGGTLQIGTNGTSGAISGTVTVNSGGILAYNRSDDVETGFTFGGSGAFVHNGSGKLTLTTDVPFAGKTTNTGGILQLGNGSTLFGNLAGEINIPSGKQLTYKYSNGQKDIFHALSGSGTVDYDSSLGGTIKIANSATTASSNFTGVANLITGTKLWSGDNSGGSYPLGNGNTINVPDFSQVWIDRAATPFNQVFNIAGKGYVGDSPELGALRVFGCTLNGQINLLADARIGGTISGATILGRITGPYQLEVLGNADFQLSIGPTNGAHTYSSTLVTRGFINALNSGAVSTGPLTLDLAGGLRLNGNNLSVASLTDSSSGLVTGTGSIVHNNHGSVAATLTVGGDNSDFTYGNNGGTFGNGGAAPLGVTKVGAGTFTVTGANTNTGVVTVNGGTLALSGSGSFANASKFVANATLDVSGIGGTLTLSSGQTLGGSGTVAGNVVAPAGSTVSPGASVGTLTASGNISLAGLLLMELNRTNAPFNSDRLVSSGGTITYGGSLLVTNIGPALQVNDTFQLFPSAVTGFGPNITLATTDATGNTYTWTNRVSLNGSVQVLSVTPAVNPLPGNIGYSLSGNTLTLSWPTNAGWSLQAQTNGLNVGLSNNWATIPGSQTITSTNIVINPADPTVFYRLFYVAP